MYHEIIFRPLYNGLIGIMNLLPWADVGVAVILFTVIVKLILYPLSKSALLTQVKMKQIEPEANRIRTQHANDRQLQAQKTMELYKTNNIKPFSGILLLIIQLPILFALISVFYKLIPSIDTASLYSFVSVPTLKTMFLGFIDLTKTSVWLALATAIVQFLQLKFSLASAQTKGQPKDASNPASLAASMSNQMKYMVPLLAFASIYWIIPARFPQAASIIALYWMTSSLMTFLQELYIRKKHLPGAAA
jgi:YidC/Oxa1 family membrane protein insertase